MIEIPTTVSLFQALSASWTSQTLTIDHFRMHPLVIDRLATLKLAHGMAPPNAMALEFGVFSGQSIRALAHAHPDRSFTGFDSFKGLPEPWERAEGDTYGVGHFALDALPPVPANVTLVSGFFEDTLADWLAAYPGEVGFMHMDADLYSACMHVLDLLTPRFSEGAVIVFDELCDWRDSGIYPKWPEGEWKALLEWLEAKGFTLRILARSPQFSAAIQVWRGEVPTFDRTTQLTFLQNLADHDAPLKARRYLADWVKADPDWAEGWQTLADWQADAGQWKRARVSVNRARALRGDGAPLGPELEVIAARTHHALDALDEAHATLARVRKIAPNHLAALKLSAQLAYQDRDYESAVSFRDRIVKIAPTSIHRQALRGARAMAGIRPEYRQLMFSGLLIQHLIDTRHFTTVLDVGSGAGEQARALRAAGKRVTELDYGKSHYFKEAVHDQPDGIVIGDFLEARFSKPFDCVLASHVLEHQRNVHAFLVKAHELLCEGGVLAISVPPLKHQIVGGHLTLWNAGLLLYNLVLAGFDCRDPWVRRYGYNISVAVEKRSISPEGLVFDSGDITRISAYLPPGFDEGFHGDIWTLG